MCDTGTRITVYQEQMNRINCRRNVAVRATVCRCRRDAHVNSLISDGLVTSASASSSDSINRALHTVRSFPVPLSDEGAVVLGYDAAMDIGLCSQCVIGAAWRMTLALSDWFFLEPR